METLKINDKVIISGIEGIVKSEFRYNKPCFLIKRTSESNYIYKYDSCFYYKIKSIDNIQKFQQELLNYHGKGNILGHIGETFPPCKSLEDLTKFINAIEEEYRKEHGYKIEWEDSIRLIKNVGNVWKKKLLNIWSEKIALQERIEIDYDLYLAIKKYLSKKDKKLYNSIFGIKKETYNIGDKFKVYHENFILCEITSSSVALMSLHSGRKIGETINAENIHDISEKEMKQNSYFHELEKVYE